MAWRRNWLSTRERGFDSLEEFNARLGAHRKVAWAGLRHPKQKTFSVTQMPQLENSHVLPKPENFDCQVQDVARLSST